MKFKFLLIVPFITLTVGCSQITELKEENTSLSQKLDSTVQEHKELQIEQQALSNNNSELTRENKELENEIGELNSKILDLEADNTTSTNKVNALQHEIKELESTIATLEEESSNEEFMYTDGEYMYGDGIDTLNSGGFENCTELRQVHPEGVPYDHPDYQEKMDRDGDAWACER